MYMLCNNLTFSVQLVCCCKIYIHTVMGSRARGCDNFCHFQTCTDGRARFRLPILRECHTYKFDELVAGGKRKLLFCVVTPSQMSIHVIERGMYIYRRRILLKRGTYTMRFQ